MTELLELSDKDFKVAIIKMLSLETNDKIESQKRNRKIQQRYKIKTKWKFRTEKQNDHNKKKSKDDLSGETDERSSELEDRRTEVIQFS